MTAGGRAKTQRHTPGDPGWPVLDIVRRAEVAIAGPSYDEHDPACSATRGPFVCRRCTSVLDIADGLEPTPLCDKCAQDAARELGAALLLVTDAINGLPPALAASVHAAIADHVKKAHADAFVYGVLGLATEKVLRRRGSR